jgi:antitoxin HicB
VVPDLPGCITVGDTLEELWANVKDAEQDWIDEATKDGRPIPQPTGTNAEEYSGRLLVRLGKSLHRSLAQRARADNVSMNTLIVELLSRGIGAWPRQAEVKLPQAGAHTIDSSGLLLMDFARETQALTWESRIEER